MVKLHNEFLEIEEHLLEMGACIENESSILRAA